MQDRIQKITEEIENFGAETKEQLELFRIKLLSKKGDISVLFDDFKTVSAEQKKELGQRLNELKNKAQEKINGLKERFEQGENKTGNTDAEGVDLSLPG